MNWEWVGDYPVFVYTTFLTDCEFRVKLVRGVKGDQNAGDTGPSAPPWREYIQRGLTSHHAVACKAMINARKLLEMEPK